jgi:hypothetical protein
VMTTLSSISQLMVSAGAVIGGALHDPQTIIIIFVVINLVAAGAAINRRVLTAVAS